jgi:subtilase family serine protease
MFCSLFKSSVAAVALGLIGTGAALAGAPKASDLGSLVERAGDQMMSVTIALKLSDVAGAESMMQRVATPGDALYRQFLTPDQVLAQFGPSQKDVDHVISSLTMFGLTVERTSSTTLKATAPVSTIERVFQTSLHQFQVEATEKAPGYTYQAAATKPVVPSQIAPMVNAVLGFSTAPALHPHYRQAPGAIGGAPLKQVGSSTATGNPFGSLTVTDFANRYDVEPLYAHGVTGKGRTLAVVTLAAFTPSDAFAYWNSLNLKTDPNRITIVNVDGGPGAPSDASGSIETTLDVEQSGGIAPGAKIIVYQAPNTNQGFVDVFAKAIDDNKADSMSTSFGLWEFFDDLANSPVTDPFSGETVSSLQAMHELFVEAALQGESTFAAAGDSGAFDSNDELPTTFTHPLSVDYPGSDSAITSSGGTTLPGSQTFAISATKTLTINNPLERVWGWDYLEPLCAALNESIDACGIFSVGGGGGVSVFFGIPLYQNGIVGTQLSQPGQSLIEEDVTPPQDLFDLPANFAGRNVPDFAYNADPETGYEIFYTSSVTGFGVQTFFGGTSFVGPQLNGVTALLGQNAGGQRLGLLNVPLYTLARFGLTTLGPNPLVNTITAGDNWFYTARNGYSPAAGLGTINVANLAAVLR